MIFEAAYTVIFLVTSLVSVDASSRCNPVCGRNHLPYPFGVSPGCVIRLNCTSDGDLFLGGFPVQFVDQDSVRINIEAKCNRPIKVLHTLFSHNYQPKSTNAILLYNCTAFTPCSLPAISVKTHFETLKCSQNSNISCFNQETPTNFFNYGALPMILRQCEYLLSSISGGYLPGSGMSLDVQVMELTWWLQGDCKCSKDAGCTKVNAWNGPGYRCQCRDGLIGDGYIDGGGCRKDCNVKKYLSGECGGAIRIVVLVGGTISTGAALVICTWVCCGFIRRRSTWKLGGGYRKCSINKATEINIPVYPYKEIERATSGFSEKRRLGTGAYGTVYSGKLDNDLWVAIKRIKPRDTDSIEQVLNEIKLISSMSHPNLVRLLGCSIERGEQILVYEFMPNGTLCQHLQRERGDGLPWQIRLAIATETAQAIAHLHSFDPPIYHRDIKSSNILLDYHFRSKVADFGLSRLGRTEFSHISTAPQGTPGYLDPQYHQLFHLSDKSDVYSFGVVLIEVVTALKVVDFSRPQNEVNLANFAIDKIGNGHLDEIVDPLIDLHSDAWTLFSVRKVAELAFRCLAFHRDVRPSMVEVAAELEEITLGRHASSKGTNDITSSKISPSSSSSSSSPSSNPSDKTISLTIQKSELEHKTLLSNMESLEIGKTSSPVSVQDPWLSELSPS